MNLRRELRRKRERVRELASTPRPDELGARMDLLRNLRAAKRGLMVAWLSRYGSRVFDRHRARAMQAVNTVGEPTWKRASP